MSGAASPATRPARLDELADLEPMWRALYDLQREQGLRMPQPEDAFALWLASMKPAFGRFTQVFVVDRETRIEGFLAARLRNAPPWFGGAATGFVSEVWVEPAARGHGAGKALVKGVEGWFRERGIKRIELQVMLANAPARALYARLGWHPENVQMATELGPAQ